jgi:hypothetical protein
MGFGAMSMPARSDGWAENGQYACTGGFQTRPYLRTTRVMGGDARPGNLHRPVLLPTAGKQLKGVTRVDMLFCVLYWNSGKDRS